MHPVRSGLLRLGSALTAILLTFAACSSGGEAARSISTSTTSVAVGDSAQAPSTTVAAPPAEQYSGSLDGFYAVPKPLPKAPAGTLIRVQQLKHDGSTTTVRVMYHSRDVLDRDRAVTGVITYPTAAAPSGGWPVVAWDHGTTGLASPCAPSRLGGSAPGFGVPGVWVASDYIGLGPIGERHSYLSGPGEAHSVIDAVRAARNLTAAHAGERWLDVGHSQGGHAALWTNQLAASYAPELKLLGTVSLAPAAVFERTFGPSDQLIPRMVLLLGLFGMEAAYKQVDVDDYVGPQIAAKQDVVDEGCMNAVIDAFAGVPAKDFYRHDPLKTEPARSIILANDPGQERAASPLLLVYGTADTWVVSDRVDALYERLCSVGQVTTLLKIDGATHDTVTGAATPAITKWLDDRLAAKPESGTCKSATG